MFFTSFLLHSWLRSDALQKRLTCNSSNLLWIFVRAVPLLSFFLCWNMSEFHFTLNVYIKFILYRYLPAKNNKLELITPWAISSHAHCIMATPMNFYDLHTLSLQCIIFIKIFCFQGKMCTVYLYMMIWHNEQDNKSILWCHLI